MSCNDDDVCQVQHTGGRLLLLFHSAPILLWEQTYGAVPMLVFCLSVNKGNLVIPEWRLIIITQM